MALFGDTFTARFDELDDISEEALLGTAVDETDQGEKNAGQGNVDNETEDEDGASDAENREEVAESSSEEVESDIGEYN